MKERPILWSAPMVLALLAGRKTQTRRVAKFVFKAGQSPEFSGYTPGTYCTDVPSTGYVLRSRGAGHCWNDRTEALKPYALVGDRVWGRETFCWAHTDEADPVYRADHPWRDDVTWKPSIFMPRRASRLLHEVTAVRIERLQDITEADALAEGIEALRNPATGEEVFTWPGGMAAPPEAFKSARAAYLVGWESINGDGSAAKNPWVWVISFKAAIA